MEPCNHWFPVSAVSPLFKMAECPFSQVSKYDWTCLDISFPSIHPSIHTLRLFTSVSMRLEEFLLRILRPTFSSHNGIVGYCIPPFCFWRTAYAVSCNSYTSVQPLQQGARASFPSPHHFHHFTVHCGLSASFCGNTRCCALSHRLLAMSSLGKIIIS